MFKNFSVRSAQTSSYVICSSCFVDVQGNPFSLRNITRVAANHDIDHAIGLSSSAAFGGSGGGYTPCVVVASPGFLQSGVSRHLFERWCDDARNGVIMAGYTVEGTLAHQLLSAPKEITCLGILTLKYRFLFFQTPLAF